MRIKMETVNEKLREEITERKRAEEALQAEKNKLQSVVDAMASGLSIQDTDYNIIYQNESMRIISGDHVGEKCYRAYEGKEGVCDGCPVEKAFRDGKPHTSERRGVTASGEVTFLENTANPVRDARGRIVSCLEIVRDINERKQAEQALLESEERFRSIVENSQAGIMIVDDAYRLIYVNPQLCRMAGYSPDELIGQNFRQFLDEESKQLVAERYIQRQRGEEVPPRYEFNIVRKDGQKRRVEISSAIIKDSAGEVRTVAQILDITERKQAEEALQQSEERLKTYIESAPDGVYINDLKGTFLYGNRKAEEITGYKKEELLGKTFLKLNLLPAKYLVKASKLLALNVIGKPTGPDEFELIKKDGTRTWVEITTTPIKQAGGKTEVIGFVRNITERKWAEEAFRQSEERFRSIVENSHAGIMIMDDAYRFIYVNPQLCRMSGYSPNELIGQDFRQFLDEESKQLVAERYIRRQRGEEIPPRYEFNIVRKDGQKRRVEISSAIIKDSAGEVRTVAQILDITERKQAEEALRQSREQLRRMFESVTDGIVVVDLNGVITEVNRRAVEIHGFGSKDELLGKSALELVVPGDHERVTANMRKAIKQGQIRGVECTLLRADGSEFPGELSTNVLKGASGNPAGQITIIRDITERKQAEEALKLQQAYFQQLFDNSPDAIAWLDAADRFVNVNKGFETLFGYRAEEIKGRLINDTIVSEDCIEEASALSRAALNNKARRKDTVRKRKDGSLVDVDAFGYPIQFGNRTVGVYAIYSDITERKQAEEALRQSREQLRKMFESVTDGISVVGLNGIIIDTNQRTVEMHGFASKDELVGTSARELVAPGDHERLAANMRKALKEGTIRGVEHTLLKADGTEFPGELSTSVLKDASGNAVGHVTIARDITERKQAEEREKQLQQELYLSTRLASIGELAAGVAHEINNPLTGVMGFSQRLLRKSTSEEVSRGLEIIHSEAQRAAGVVQNLLTFARRRQPKKEYSNINDIVQKALELRGYALQTSNIEVMTDLAPSFPEIMVDFPQIQEVFLNIILNAEHAMNEARGGGKLIIKTREVKDYVRISFADDGPGIPPEQLDKVFDPFFTTREEKGGTGLGLSACHGIVTEHGGRIYARSKPGKGATFFVELPLSPIETTVGRRA